MNKPLTCAGIALMMIFIQLYPVTSAFADSNNSTHETTPPIQFTFNGTTKVIPFPEEIARLQVTIKEKDPPFWPLKMYLENHPVGFDITVKNPTSKKYFIDVTGDLWNPNPKDASNAIYKPESFKQSTFTLEPLGINSTEYWTKPLLPGGYVLNVSAVQIYSNTTLPGGGYIEVPSASGQSGLSFVVYSEDSRNNVYIALGTISAAFIAFGAVIVQSWLSRSTLREMKRQNETSQKQVNLMNQQLNLERRKIHLEKLIEDSIQHWRYIPRSSGEMIVSLNNSKGTSVANQVQYLEQAKSHLQAYDNIWQLYKDAPGLVKRKEELEKELEEIRQTINAEVKKELTVRDLKQRLDLNYVSQTFGDKVYGWFRNRFDNVRRVYFLKPRQGDEGEAIVDDRTFPVDLADIVAAAVTAVLENEELYHRFETAQKELIEIQEKVHSNRINFQSLLQTEVIEKVRLSGYEEIKGKCPECPKEI